ncbi:MAG: hypothetical protein ABIF82_00020 [Planctomycetota bacterium]
MMQLTRCLAAFPLSRLRAACFMQHDGWIMAEEESVRAEIEPDAVTVENGEYVRQTLIPVVT